ncbi:gustatory receptor family protein 3-like [Penaeus indicus]|uniref:gustatory receptor family protein 3-like n=1 Tax=Penaeus indicus TaxID=29960 RepID=UPI00300C16A6
MVRNTEKLFSVSLQCFYASQVVTMCLELYLVAYRVGMQTHYERGEALWQSLIITQTFAVFLLVSIQASAVYEEAEASVDVLRRGLPFAAPDRVKFHFGELITSLTGSPICITGGKFFYIHRPFIITVVGAVLSYFIIILQLMLPSVGRDRGEAPFANLTLSDQGV